MTDLTTAIRDLDDATAERLLATIARHRLQPAAGTVTVLTPELGQALAQLSGEALEPPTATPGALARTTLLLLAEDPTRQAELRLLISNPPVETFAADPVTLTVLTTAALVVLQSYIKIEYDREKGLRVKVEKQPFDKSLLGKVIGLVKTFVVHS